MSENSLVEGVSPNQKDVFRVLSLDGGGAKGVYTLGVLREIEAACGKPLCEVFNLVYGTSTGAIIATLIALGYRVEAIEELYFCSVPKIMTSPSREGRTSSLKEQAKKIFEGKTPADFKTAIGVVATNHDRERPLIFKNLPIQAHGLKDTFIPFFGSSIADAVVSSCAAFPFFQTVMVKTKNQGDFIAMDGGYVANNPTLFALADARQAFGRKDEETVVLSVGVGQYNEPKKSLLHRWIFRTWPPRLIAKMFNVNSKTIEQLRVLLFPQVPCVRIDEAFPQPEYATDLLESDSKKLKTLHALGRDSFAKFEREFREKLKI